MKGLDNLGNSCYFNCALQCLLQVPQLSNFLIVRTYNGPSEFVKEYQNMVKKVWLKKGGSENPKDLLNIFKKVCTQFDNLEQQDSQEAFLCLLDMLEKPLSPLIKQIFYGKIILETVSPSERSERIEDTSATIMFGDSGTLEEALTTHQKWSTLEGFEDSKGKVHHLATTRTMFWETPKILMLSFRMYGRKDPMEVPEFLNLKKWIHPKAPRGQLTEYELFASSTHHGSPHGGHYVALTKHKGQWYLKNDGLCMKTEFPKKGYHYFVLYKRLNSCH